MTDAPSQDHESSAQDPPPLTSLLVKLNGRISAKVEIDLSAFLHTAQGEVGSSADFVFYNQPASACGGLRLTRGESLRWRLDERLRVRLDRIPLRTRRALICVSIHDGASRGQSFGQAQELCALMLDGATGETLLRYDLTQDYAVETALVLAELRRDGEAWRLRPIGRGCDGGLAAPCWRYGVTPRS